MRYSDDNNLHVANISWQDNTTVRFHNQTYVITVQPAIQDCNNSCVTTNQSIELILASPIDYHVTVITEVCDGKLRSGKSESLLIPWKGTSEPMTYSLLTNSIIPIYWVHKY